MFINTAYIEAKASSILKQIGDEIPVDIEKCAKHLNIDIKYLDLEDSTSGFFVHKNRNSYIGCNQHQSEVRQRFTIAHELGHYCLHFNSDNPIFIDKDIDNNTESILYRDGLSSTGENRNEREANAFAAALLMPKSKIINKITSYLNDNIDNSEFLSKLASEFKVSEHAMGIRLSKLGLTSKDSY